ncbi:hypothetical protein CPB83DRAFT_847148 [Crepidotus variabilis]|uniref:Uncharacterized protein n=1 Tax=Crepidotus variabilis TaxID=179855 RepID=A0A9P6EMR1_9AGAR|nr:hypothetical protein CPB83DRAFT_847148 [Crepidotus variabilis]
MQVRLLLTNNHDPLFSSLPSMATIVERPMSALNDIQANMERNTRRNSIEIIDVDEFDDTTQRASSLSRSPPRPRPRMRTSFQPHPETIILSDSDDDDIEILPQPQRPIRPLPQSRRRLRSPPPIPIVMVPPPVPRLPRSMASFASLPLRRSSPYAAPPVRPSAEPPAFEPGHMVRLGTVTQPEAGPSNLFNPRLPRRNPAAAPSSHHTPAMGFGGALISSNNARAVREAVQAARSAHTRVISAYRRRNPHQPAGRGFLLHDPEEDDIPHIHRWIDSPHDTFLRLADRLRGRESASAAKYQKSYTHPDTPEAGFTFDFALPSPEDDGSHAKFFPPTSANAPIIIDDDDGNSGPSVTSRQDLSTSSGESSSLTTLLVCARCLDPLPLNETLGPEDEGRRVWALRCGHMIDQKCLNEIGKPEDGPELATHADPDDKKGKGKAKAIPDIVVSEHLLEHPAASIRSRLRSAASSSSSSSTPLAQLPSRPPPTKKRRTTAVIPSIEAEFEWKCPVASCHRVHASLMIDGVWSPEKEGKPLTGVSAIVNGIMDWNAKAQPRGAIPVFA